MGESAQGPARKFLIVGTNAIVTQDLREILNGRTRGQVDFRPDIRGEVANDYAAAFFGSSAHDLLGEPRVREMMLRGTRVVLLNGNSRRAELNGTNVIVLDLPFRSEDIERILDDIGPNA